MVLKSTQEPWMAMPRSDRGTDASQIPGNDLQILYTTESSAHRLVEGLAIVHSEARADAAGEACVVLVEADVEELKSFLPFLRRSCHIPTTPPTSQVIPVSRPTLRMSGSAILMPQRLSWQDLVKHTLLSICLTGTGGDTSVRAGGNISGARGRGKQTCATHSMSPRASTRDGVV